MSVTAGSDLPLDELLARRRALVAELRDVDHWHRLAAARLDLAVAAVTNIDELAGRPLPCPRLAPCGLRDVVGLPRPGEALAEAATLVELRSVLDELETYAAALRASCSEVSREVARVMCAEGYLLAACTAVAEARNDPRTTRRAVTRRPRSDRMMGRTTARRSPTVIMPWGDSVDDDNS
jgi:hypothetical protein